MNSKYHSTWSKSNVIQTYDGAKVSFRAVWKQEHPVPSLLMFPLRRSCIETSTGPSNEPRKQRLWRWGLSFSLPSRVFQGYDCYFTNVLTQRSRFDHEVLLTLDRWPAMFHWWRYLYIRTDDPPTKTSVHCELKHRGRCHSNSADSVIIFFASPPPPH